MKRILLLFILVVLISVELIGQTIPKQINYQGILKDASGNLLTGDYALTFKIYNEPTGGTPLWSEIQVLTVTNGLFNAYLGSNTVISGVPFDRSHFLGIQVGTGTELTPRTMLTPSPYAFMSMNVADNTVVKSMNGIKDNVNLVAGSNITIAPSGNDLTISAGGSGGIIGGSGIVNYFPLFTGTSVLGNSKLFEDSNGDIQFGSDGARTQLTLTANDNQDEGGQINWNGAASYDDWYQDVYQNSMRIRSSSSNDNTVEIFNNGTGKTILKVEGEIQTNPTGDANMVPIAYASVSSDGTIRTVTSTSNVTLSSHSSGSGNYYFTIDGWNVSYLTTVCIATLNGTTGGEISWNSLGGGTSLGIYTRSSTGTAQNKEFTFVVYKK